MADTKTPRPTDHCGADKDGKAITVQRSICAYVRAGAFPEQAAIASGITPATFHRWMRAGARKRARAVYADFRAAVLQAEAQARVTAETAVHAKKPLDWLTRGPGKEQKGRPGWSSLVKPLIEVTDNRTLNLLASPEMAALLQLVLTALVPHVEARKAVIAALNGLGVVKEPRRVESLPELPEGGGLPS